MNRRRFLIGSAAAGAAGLAADRGLAGASGTGWHLLGRAWVARTTDASRIDLARPGAFRALRLRAGGRGLRLGSLRLIFAGGATFDLTAQREVAPGRISSPIALPGGAERLASVDLGWRRGSGTGRAEAPLPGYGDLAEVELLGLRA